MSLSLQPTGAAVLYVQSHVQAAARGEFDRWCDSVHHFDTMRIAGFLSLRRFERIGHAGVASPFDLLTLYQLAEPGAADFDSPAYRQHTASYTPPPAVVDGAVSFERTIFRRVDVTGEPAPIGVGLVAVAGSSMSLGDLAETLRGHDDVCAVSRLERTDAADNKPGLLIVDTPTADDAIEVLDRSLAATAERSQGWSVSAFRQVFPQDGSLLRDRTFA